MRVEVDEPDPLGRAHVARHRADPDGAVATQDERRLPLADRIAHAPRGVAHDLDDRAEVLRAPVLAIGAPAPHLAIPVIAHLDARPPQPIEEPCLPQRRRRLLLAGSERACARRHSDDTEGTAHDRPV